MSFLLHYKLTPNQTAYNESAVENNNIVVSAGSDGDLILANTSTSFVMVGQRDKAVLVKASPRNNLTVNDKPSKNIALILGQQCRVNGLVVSCIQPPTGFEHAVKLDIDDKFKPSSSLGTAIGSGIINNKGPQEATSPRGTIRWFTYSLFFITLLISLILPVVSHYTQQPNVNIWMQKLTHYSPVSNRFFSTGPLVSAHQTPSIGKNCLACHTTPFMVVSDQSCVDCHDNIGGHESIEKIASTQTNINHLSQFRCADCHREHNEPVTIIVRNNQLCVNCHGKDDMTDDVRQVENFSKHDHPEFKLNLLTHLDDKQRVAMWMNKRIRWPLQNQVTPALKESSNLKFSHQLHLDENKVQHQTTGDLLTCNDCHQLMSDEEHFKPITMDNACRGCHQLSFDSFEPDIELPHGNTYSVLVAMQAHFIRQFSDPLLRDIRAQMKPRRVPNKRQSIATCTKIALLCGKEETIKEADFQFDTAGCVTCHIITKTLSASVFDKFVVSPVKLNDDWYSNASFNHRTHAINASNEQAIGNLDKNSVSCLNCHAVMESVTSTDILIPKQGQCLSCHDDNNEFNVALQCVDCHSFHVDNVPYPHTKVKPETVNHQAIHHPTRESSHE
jgi:predicted CXXCH cytochrome family protein